jgi:hypothetical protein
MKPVTILCAIILALSAVFTLSGCATTKKECCRSGCAS